MAVSLERCCDWRMMSYLMALAMAGEGEDWILELVLELEGIP